MQDINGTYFVSIRKNRDVFYLDLRYKIKGKIWTKIEEDSLFDNNNELPVATFVPGRDNELYFKNIQFLEKCKFIIVELINIDENYSKYKYSKENPIRLNNLKIHTLEEYKVFQLIDCNKLIKNFEEFRHNNAFRKLRIDNIETERIYIEHENKVYGKFLHEKKNISNVLLKPDSNLYILDSYKIDDLDIIYINKNAWIEKDYKFVIIENEYKNNKKEDFIEIDSIIRQVVNSSCNVSVDKNQLDKLIEYIKKREQMNDRHSKLLLNRIYEQKVFDEAIDKITQRALEDKNNMNRIVENILSDEQRMDRVVENILADGDKLDKVFKKIVYEYPETVKKYNLAPKVIKGKLSLPSSESKYKEEEEYTIDYDIPNIEVTEKIATTAKDVEVKIQEPEIENTVRTQIENRKIRYVDYNGIWELVEKVQKFINKKSNMELSYNEVVNILICVSQGFLTIFAGEPGTGKTSLCNTLAKSLGLNTGDENNRFIEISVEKGWKSKNDFVGYYNPFKDRFDASNSKIFEALTILNEEKIMKDENIEFDELPYFMMLDEANLSSMEHYWADFMSACDGEPDKDYSINLGKNHIYSIPPYLRFLATINYDHTTEELSPRLIDRAWIILLECKDLSSGINSLKNEAVLNSEEMIDFAVLEEFMNIEDEGMPGQIEGTLCDIVGSLRAKGIHVGYRVCKMMKDYCAVAADLFEIEDEDYTEVLDFAVAQKILPLIDGYGKDFRAFLTEFMENQLKGMERSQAIVRKMITIGDKNIKHYHFFSR